MYLSLRLNDTCCATAECLTGSISVVKKMIDTHWLTINMDRTVAITGYREVLKEHAKTNRNLKELRQQCKEAVSEFDQSEEDLKSLQSGVGQIVRRQLSEDKFIVKASNGPQYVVGYRKQNDRNQFKNRTRVTVVLDMTILTIMRMLPREVDPLVHNMNHEPPGDAKYSEIGGLTEQIRELHEVIELPLLYSRELVSLLEKDAYTMDHQVQGRPYWLELLLANWMPTSLRLSPQLLWTNILERMHD